MTTLQASLLLNLPLTPSLSSPSSSLKRLHFSRCSPLSLPNFNLAPSPTNFRLTGRRNTSIPCALSPENANLDQEPSFIETQLDSDHKDSTFDEIDGGDSSSGGGGPEREELAAEEEVGLENGVEESEGLVEKKSWTKLPVVVFMMGLWVAVRRGFEKLLASEWLSWWPFSRQEKRLERLIAEADADPKDPVKQSVLLAELNKHRFSSC